MKFTQLIEFIKSDLKHFYSIEVCKDCPSLKEKIHSIIFSYGLHAIVVYRFGKYVDSAFKKPILLPVKYFASILHQCLNILVRAFYGIHIDGKADIGKGLYIGHFGGIHIEQCHIGSNCSLHQQVRIGTTGKGDHPGTYPIIGDNVWIGSHVKVGNVVVENNSTIASGSIVTNKVLKGSLVMGNPARILFKNYDNTTLL